MGEELVGIDAALLILRPLWMPTTSGRPVRGEEAGIDLSTVLVVHIIGGVEPGLSVAEIAEKLGVAPTTASRLCARAASAGFVRKSPAIDDSRRLVLTLSPEGVELRAKSFAYRLDYLRSILDDWERSDIDTFQRLLTRFADAVHEHPPTASRSPLDYSA